MSSYATRALLVKVFEEWGSSGSMDAWLAALSNNLVWTVTGSKENSGTFKGKQSYRDDVLGNLSKWVKRPPVPRLKKLIVEGEWATAWLSAKAEALDGSEFIIDYCWLINVVHSEVVEVIGFYA